MYDFNHVYDCDHVYDFYPRSSLIALSRPGSTGIVLVPTRELALQTASVAKELGKHLGVQVVTTTGGTSLQDDIMRFQQTGSLMVHVLFSESVSVLHLHVCVCMYVCVCVHMG